MEAVSPRCWTKLTVSKLKLATCSTLVTKTHKRHSILKHSHILVSIYARSFADFFAGGSKPIKRITKATKGWRKGHPLIRRVTYWRYDGSETSILKIFALFVQRWLRRDWSGGIDCCWVLGAKLFKNTEMRDCCGMATPSGHCGGVFRIVKRAAMSATVPSSWRFRILYRPRHLCGVSVIIRLCPVGIHPAFDHLTIDALPML